MRRAYAMLGFGTAVVVGAASLTLIPKTSQASATQATFLVPAHDGYGVAECLVSGHTCGQAVADTWCETQGFSHAVSFRQIAADEVTGSVERVAVTETVPPVSITCAN